MLTQSSLHSSIDFAQSLASDHSKKEDNLRDWIAGAEIWKLCPNCEENAHDCCKREALIKNKETRKMIDGSLICPKSSQLLTPSKSMSVISAPNLVYQRRKLRNNSKAIKLEDPSDPSMKEPLVSSDITLAKCITVENKHVSNDALKNGLHGTTELLSGVNDCYSSSKSNNELDLASKKHQVGDTGECSSSGIRTEATWEYTSEKDFCISILRSKGLLNKRPIMNPSSQSAVAANDNTHYRPCKICRHSETTLNMLICDNCEEAYHLACCNPRLTKINSLDWFCHTCLKKKHKLVKKASSKRSSMGITSVPASNCRNSTSDCDMGPIAYMLKESEPYTTGVRVGKAFQAEVPDWSGPIMNDANYREPLKLDPSETIHLHEGMLNKDCRVSSIGNWLQCQNVIDVTGEGLDGTICGKWRRAPLFEVQTDAWDCFCSVLWDPTHSDCAVPQEIETEQVLKQLKYIEMLRPRLAAKRQRLDTNERRSSKDRKEKIRNIKTS